MRVLDRVFEIIRSEVDAALDRFEDPEAMYEQALRDGQEELGEARVQLRKLVAEQLKLKDEIARETELHQTWENRAAQALEENNEPLAKQAVAVGLEHQRRAGKLAASLGELDTYVENMKRSLQGREEKIKLLTERKDWVLLKMRGAQVMDTAEGFSTYEESPLDLFDRMKSKAERAYYEGEAAETLVDEDVLAQKFAELKKQSGPSQSVQDKLAALKAKLQE